MAKHAAVEPDQAESCGLRDDAFQEAYARDAFSGGPEDSEDAFGEDDAEEMQLFASAAPEPGVCEAESPAAAAFPYPDQRRSRRTRKILIVLIIMVALAIVATAVAVALVSAGQKGAANERAVSESAAADQIALSQQGANDASSQTREGAEMPAIAGLVGLSLDDAVAGIGHGAQIVADEQMDLDDGEASEGDASDESEANEPARMVTVELTEDPADTRTGIPTVYLGLDEEGAVVEAIFSSGLSQLGYAQMSFADAVTSARVVDNVLAEAGIAVDSSAVALPVDPAAYTTYAADGSSVKSESYAFTGTCDVPGQACAWTVELAYDYSAAASSGDVSNVVRRITLTVELA